MGDTGAGYNGSGQGSDPAYQGQDGRGRGQGPTQSDWFQGAQGKRTPQDDAQFLQMLLEAMDSDAFIAALEDETMLKKFRKWLAGFLRPAVRETAPVVSGGSSDTSALETARKQAKAWRTKAQELEQENERLKNELKQAKQPSYARQQEQRELQDLRSEVTKLKNDMAVRDRQISSMNDRFAEAQHLYAACTTEKSQLSAELASTKKQIHDLENDLAARDREIGSITGHFSEAQSLYEAFQLLDGLTSRELRTIFRGSTLEEFVYCGLQWNKLENLWEYMKDRILNGKDIGSLEPIFKYFFDAYNSTSDRPLYRRTTTRVGTSFDTERHIRHQDGRSAGPIAIVLLEGYENTNTGKCPKKPVVRL